MRKARSTIAFCKVRTCSAKEVITNISPVGTVRRFYLFFLFVETTSTHVFCPGGFVQIRTGTFDDVGERSQFELLVLDASTPQGCIQFQYNIAGTDNDWLQVKVEDYWTGRQTCMWHTNGSTVPNRWVTAEAPLNLTDKDRYSIVFEARKGLAGGLGVVSLDHLVISSRPCLSLPNIFVLPSTSFHFSRFRKLSRD